MKLTVKIKTEVEAKTLSASCGVRYWEDATVNGQEDNDGHMIPCRSGGVWQPLIDIDSGVITNWYPGTVADIHYKVCDAGEYTVLDSEGKRIGGLPRGSYVPRIMCPKENGYGDYVIMQVDATGKIGGWNPALVAELVEAAE